MSPRVRTICAAVVAAAATACARPAPIGNPAPATEAVPTPPAATLNTAVDRWQILLNDGRYLYEAELVRAAGDSVMVTHAADTVALALADIDELRLVQPSARPATGGRNTYNGLTGMDDAVYKFARIEPAEQRRVVAELLRERDAAAAARAP
jgi:hypothetical protein